MSLKSPVALPATFAAAVVGFVLAISNGTPPTRAAAGIPEIGPEVRARIQRAGHARVIVELRLAAPHIPEGILRNDPAIREQRQRIGTRRAQLLSKLPAAAFRILHQYQTLPYVVLDADATTINALEALDSDVVQVIEDEIVRPALAQSVPLIQGDQAWAAGYDGTGTVIAVLDTGIDSAHPFLAGKVVEEACYSSTVSGTSQTFCPNGLEVQTGPGAGAPCPLDDCAHGTHVAGIAAGNGAGAGQTFSGVAKGAQLMAVQVFSRIVDPFSCGGVAPCVGAFTSDIVAGLERVHAVAGTRNIVSVNMSLGGTAFSAPCDTQPYKPAIDNLRAIGIATVIASGNNGSSTTISAPGCISTAVSVGSTNKSDVVSWFSNVAPFLSLFAPGESITSSVPGGTYATYSGTSMATPHVAGTWAIIKQAAPNAGVSLILNALRQTGLPVTDTRPLGSATIPRIKIYEALQTLVPTTNPAPEIAALSPSRVRAGAGAVSLTVTGSGFNAFSVARWNGVAVPTTVASTTSLQASIAATLLTSMGTAQVSVFTPAPGGGTSSELTFVIDPPPTLTPNVTLVTAGNPVTVALAQGFGGSTDWLALAMVGAAETSYVQWTYVGTNITDRTWTATPPTAGTYEFRLYPNNGYVRAATSAPITAVPAQNPVPVVTSLSPSSIDAGGAQFTLKVNGSNFVASSMVQWNGSNRPTTFLNSTQVQATIGAADIAAVGTATITVASPQPGGGTSSELTFTINLPPSLTVSATNVTPGGSVTVTLANGAGGAQDWLALSTTTAPNNSYIQYVYVGAGVTARTWTVAMPATPGAYEFRLFLNNGYTRSATSPTVVVEAATGTVPTITSLSPSGAVAGGPAFTLAVTGTGFVNNSVVRWNGADRATTFMSGTQLEADIPASDIATAGTAQLTVFMPGGGTSPAVPFVIGSGANPTLTVSSTTAAGGGGVTVTLTNGAGGAKDWIALAATTAPNTSYAQYIYVGTGVTTRTWTATMPAAGGTYEFRLFLNNGYTRAATSPSISVTPAPNPVPVVTSLSPNAAVVGMTSLTVSVNGTGFVSSSIVRWNGVDRATTFISATQVRTTLTAADFATIGAAQVRVFSPAPGGGTSSALTFAIVAPPVLSVSSTTVPVGGTVTMTLTGGLGGNTDWLAFAAAGAADTSYLQYIYVGAGAATRTWTVTVPNTPGAFEFRLFLNNGYTRVATSPLVTVVAP